MARLIRARKSNNDHRRVALLPAGADGFAVADEVQRSGRTRPEGASPEGPGRVRGAASGSPAGDLQAVPTRGSAGSNPAGGIPPAAEVSPAQPALDKSQSYETHSNQTATSRGKTAAQAWRQEHRWELLRGLRKLSSKPRVRSCKKPIGATDVGVVVNDGHAHMTGLESCANVWVCPVCAAKIREGRRSDVVTALDIHTNLQGGGLVFMTATLAHTPEHRLDDLLKLLAEMMTYISRQRAYIAWRERVGIVGNITALEVTYGENGWHPHRHTMYLTERQLSVDEVAEGEAIIKSLQDRFLAKKGWKLGKDRVGIRLEHVADPTDGEKLGKYVTKLQAGFELTRGDLKQSRAADGKGAMPFDLLERALAGDEKAKKRWGEFERAMTGKSAVRFSKFLRRRLGMDAALTDQELADQEVGGERVLRVTAKLYRGVFWEGQVVTMLRAAEQGGAVGVLRLLRRFYGDRIWAAEDIGGLRVGISRAGP